MKRFKNAYDEECKITIQIRLNEITDLAEAAFELGIIAEKLKKGFQSTEIWTFNQNVFDDTDHYPEKETGADKENRNTNRAILEMIMPQP